MNRKMDTTTGVVVSAVSIFLFTLALISPASVMGEASPVYESMQKGKETFIAECGKCHTLKYAINETYSEDDWSLTVGMMVSNGAQLTSGQKTLIIDYLTTKSVFEEKCSVCHKLERPLSKTKDLEGWKTTVTRMAGKRQGHLSAEEIEAIAAFLALGYPEAKD
ncbi:c-type cytochrome [Candidatus Moduliflexota bacterium]